MSCGRILFENYTLLDDTFVFVSSEQLQHPKTFLIDPLRSKRWRSKLGWNITSELNDKLDFSEGGPTLTATLTAGNYTTGAALAAEIKTQLDAVGALTYTVTYSGVTNKFTIAASGVFELRWFTGPNATSFSVGIDLGFDVTADDTGAASYLADFASYHTREWIKYDLQTAMAVLAMIAFDGNFISGTVVTIQANATDVWSAPTFSQVLTADPDLVKHIFFLAAAQSFRYWRVLIDDVQNPDGFTELGVVYIGDYFEPDNGYSAAFTEDRAELTVVERAEQGATFQHVRKTSREYPLQWLGESEADKDIFIEFAELVQVGRPFFMAFEPDVDIQNTLYVMLGSPMKRVFQAPTHWRFSTDMAEVLG